MKSNMATSNVKTNSNIWLHTYLHKWMFPCAYVDIFGASETNSFVFVVLFFNFHLPFFLFSSEHRALFSYLNKFLFVVPLLIIIVSFDFSQARSTLI